MVDYQQAVDAAGEFLAKARKADDVDDTVYFAAACLYVLAGGILAQLGDIHSELNEVRKTLAEK